MTISSGTPVIAWPGGSVAEVLDDGVTGFIVNEIDDAVEATQRIGDLDRRRCREVFDERFTVARMARDYVAVYEALISRNAEPPEADTAARVA